MKKLLLLLFITGCINNTFDKKAETLKPTTYISAKPTKYCYQFDSTKSENEHFDKVYTDTFSVDETQFKLSSNPDSLGDLELQVLNNGLWESNLTISYGINGNASDIDVNKDGFNDFRNSLLRGSEFYLFDSTKKRFASA